MFVSAREVNKSGPFLPEVVQYHVDIEHVTRPEALAILFTIARSDISGRDIWPYSAAEWVWRIIRSRELPVYYAYWDRFIYEFAYHLESALSPQDRLDREALVQRFEEKVRSRLKRRGVRVLFG